MRQNPEGHTPFHLATLYGNKSVIQALVDKGQNIEDIDNNGRTALFLAIRQCTEAKDDSRGFCRIYKLWYKKIVKLGLWEL